MSPRVTDLAPSPAAATSELPDDGDAEAKRIDVVAFVVDVAFAAAAFLAVGRSSDAHAAAAPVDDDEDEAEVEAVAPARMREAAWRSIAVGERERRKRERVGFEKNYGESYFFDSTKDFPGNEKNASDPLFFSLPSSAPALCAQKQSQHNSLDRPTHVVACNLLKSPHSEKFSTLSLFSFLLLFPFLLLCRRRKQAAPGARGSDGAGALRRAPSSEGSCRRLHRRSSL